MNAVALLAAPWLKRAFALLRSVGPYVAIEILLPGGTLIALLLWLSRRAARSPLVAESKRPAIYATICP